MPRPAVDLTPYKETILGLYEGGVAPGEIANYVAQTFELPTLSDRTIRRRLEDWKDDYTPRRNKTTQTPLLRVRIKELFNGERYLDDGTVLKTGTVGMRDDAILDILREEGFQIALRALVKIRKEEGLVRRGRGDWEAWEKGNNGGQDEQDGQDGHDEQEKQDGQDEQREGHDGEGETRQEAAFEGARGQPEAS
ncbi:hypothetical protein K402DRAFT_401719 [Aulographum hederae CBS 113979]|uniref:Clr5 domain-containing protein n=1 Tax=Aulographum hederae CBS 113979 TaxID=1176131 RepID=A0A6G1H8X0_9PEZI|nr:hypothetical protein K402DRAFT_401719 [Aulographum hederae CBS 113979]